MFTRSTIRSMVTICVCLLVSFSSPSRASTSETLVLTVNSTLDQRDFATNSVCSAGAPINGDCTLRAAISEAIGNLPFQDVLINIPAGNYLLTIPPDTTNDIHTGDLDLPNSTSSFTISIVGTDTQPAVIDANGLDRVFRIGAGVHLSIQNAVIRGGIIKPTDANLYGAGIANNGNLALEKVTIEGNKGDCSTVSCSATFAGAGIAHMGHGYLTILDSIIQNNIAYNSSAIYNDSAQITIKNSSITHNHSVASASILNHGTMEVINSTISGNSTNDNSMAGFYNTGELRIYSSTISNPGGAANIFNITFGTVRIQDSILAAYTGNYMTNCDEFSTGTWISTGYNIFSDDSCPVNLPAGDMQNTNPLLGPLGYWGGPTPTLPLNSNSPAINHRPSACMTPLLPITSDQRHYPRNDTLCDTGAFEGAFNIYQAFLPLMKR